MKKVVVMLLALLVPALSFAQISLLNQYKLGSGDLVKINVYGQDDLTLETRLTDIGVVNYPYLGEIKLTGMTVSELEAYIYTGLKGDYLIEPSVSVSILEYRPFFINGEVEKPGGYAFQPGLTIDKAAALAGGFTERASKTKIYIDREVEGRTIQLVGERSMPILPGDIINIEQSFF